MNGDSLIRQFCCSATSAPLGPAGESKQGLFWRLIEGFAALHRALWLYSSSRVSQWNS